MISDMLFDTAQDIREELKKEDLADYDPRVLRKLEAVLILMETLSDEIGRPPASGAAKHAAAE